MLQRFDDAIALEEIGEGRYRGRFDRAWWVVVGPNGGITAAMLLRAAMDEVGEDRTPRSLTVHYVRPPGEGTVEVVVDVQSHGRSVTFVSCRMLQSERLVATALVALATERDAVQEWEHRTMPNTPGLDASYVMEPAGVDVPIRDRWDEGWTIGVPGRTDTALSGGHEVGGWLRLMEPEPYSAPLLAAMADAWVPAVMVHTGAAVHTPTLELTVHFRRDVTRLGIDPSAYCLAHFRQHSAHEGFLDESGEIWAPDGKLLVICRQMGVVLPRPPGQPAPGRTFRPRHGA